MAVPPLFTPLLDQTHVWESLTLGQRLDVKVGMRKVLMLYDLHVFLETGHLLVGLRISQFIYRLNIESMAVMPRGK